MSLSDSVFDALLILLYLSTPLIWAATLYFQDRNWSKGRFLPPTEPTHDAPVSHAVPEPIHKW